MRRPPFSATCRSGCGRRARAGPCSRGRVEPVPGGEVWLLRAPSARERAAWASWNCIKKGGEGRRKSGQIGVMQVDVADTEAQPAQSLIGTGSIEVLGKASRNCARAPRRADAWARRRPSSIPCNEHVFALDSWSTCSAPSPKEVAASQEGTSAAAEALAVGEVEVLGTGVEGEVVSVTGVVGAEGSGEIEVVAP